MLMRTKKTEKDKIANIINALNGQSREYWAFKGAKREHTHAFIQYPAMMVPQMQNKIIDIFINNFPGIRSVYDPFVGSGTVMTETMLHGLSFGGQDINPLAMLVCSVKKGPFSIESLKKKIILLNSRIAEDANNFIEIDFKNRDKWFTKDVSCELSKIRRAIMQEKSLKARRFFWVAMAETVRYTSNSRTSTFKLHVRAETDIADRDISPISYFSQEVADNLSRAEKIANVLSDKTLLNRTSYSFPIHLKCKDVLKGGIFRKKGKFDLLITSPPYGDNTTTVPYGQYSYLPLQWINSKDLPTKWDDSYLRTTQEIDRRSLGGSLHNKKQILNVIAEKSISLKALLAKLKDDEQERQYKVAVFFYDMDKALKNITSQLSPKAFMVFTLGNRRVANIVVPMNSIMRELLETRGATFITEIERDIPAKRMASKNRSSATMNEESILVMRNGEE